MKTSFFFLALFAFAFIIHGCSKPKPEKMKVGEMAEYRDPAYGFSIKYPKEWLSMGESGRAMFVQSEEVVNNFLDPLNGKRAGAQVSVQAFKQEEGKTVDVLMADGLMELQQTATMKVEETITIGGKEAKKYNYEIPVTNKLSIYGYQIYIPLDTMLFSINFRAFGDYLEATQDVFIAMQSSFTPPTILAKTDNRPRPSDQFDKYDTPYFSVEYPSNFNFTSPAKGKNDFVVQLGGERLDCTIRFDVFGAQDLTIEKVYEQNKGKYKATSAGEAMVDGLKAPYVNYAPAKDIASRAYFMVKNNKVIRVTLNWFSPETELYLKPFEKVVNAMKMK